MACKPQQMNDVAGRPPANKASEMMSTRDLQLRTIALLEKIARSQRVLERRVDAVEKTLAQAAAAAAATEPPVDASFPQFRRMPPEIRHRVWAMAIPTRALRLRMAGKSGPISRLPPPAIAGTCREARAVASLDGGMVSLAMPNPKGVSTTYWAWFDGRHDVLELERWMSVERDEPKGIRAVVRRARHILAPRADAEWFARLFRETAPLMRRVSLKFDTSLVSRCAWEPDVVRALFGGVNTVETLDLEDAGEIARVKDVLKGHWRCPFFCDFDLEGWAAARLRTSSGRERDEEWMRRLEGSWMSEVARGWVAARKRSADEAKRLDAVMDLEDPEVRDALAGMPDVRLVRAYLLADVHSTC
ncbi:hypothetical protein CSOJ01_06774 [Colletotrichum sojae]|uniref:2EXR domain-containing protein n=1 Tax=Colletotrichum sojae TaxID=2175907 RepID=A0A8H6MUN9_9PEZI|nr:hypothetical protein CSOJ01_06774 [Colletotrichum sojae]